MPEKNHYIPIFYQKRWAGSDRLVCVYSKPYKEVKALRRHPDRIGFEMDLYTIPGVEVETASHLERKFFQQADNDAAQALDLMERHPERGLDSRLKSGWSRFVMSLVHRTPEEVRSFFSKMPEHVRKAEKEFEDNYSDLRRPDDPMTFAEFKLKNRRGNPEGIAAAMFIQKVIDSAFVGNHIINMRWRIVSLKSAYTFLTCDRPIIMTNGLAKPDSHFAIPIGPRKLFLATNTDRLSEEITSMDANELVTIVNDLIAKQARRFVIGCDDSQLRFVANRFGTRLPSTPLSRFPSLEEWEARAKI